MLDDIFETDHNTRGRIRVFAFFFQSQAEDAACLKEEIDENIPMPRENDHAVSQIKLKVLTMLLWIFGYCYLRLLKTFLPFIERPSGPNKMDLNIHRSFLDF